MYGSIITRTGWLFEYVDGLCLARALELLEFWRRQDKAQGKSAQPSARAERDYDSRLDKLPRVPLSENVAEGQFNTLKAMMSGPGGAQPVMKIPEHLRDAIRWAEAEREKHGLS